MKKMPFYKIFILTLSVFAILTYVLVLYLESKHVFDSIGVGNTVLTAMVIPMLPALLISIWWWNSQDKE
ncbi:MAG: hypothetical protein CL797_08940 [Chromatiales bacterium]|nr:hypothetical protein [Chromatiales bacterium]